MVLNDLEYILCGARTSKRPIQEYNWKALYVMERSLSDFTIKNQKSV